MKKITLELDENQISLLQEMLVEKIKFFDEKTRYFGYRDEPGFNNDNECRLKTKSKTDFMHKLIDKLNGQSLDQSINNKFKFFK
jgi:hypothetical protein